MRTIQQTVRPLAVAVLALSLFGFASQSRAQQQGPVEKAARVIRIKGAARYNDGSGYHALNVGDLVMAGGTIQTGERSEVDLRMGEAPIAVARHLSAGNPAAASAYQPEEADVNLVRVQENSVLAIEKLSEQGTGIDKVSETQLNLKAGRILGNVKKLSASSHYEVKLPNGVAGIRGSTYLIGADGTVFMLTGSAVISMVIPVPGGGTVITQTFTINAGESFNYNAVIAAVAAATANATSPAAAVAAAQTLVTQLAGAAPAPPPAPGQAAAPGVSLISPATLDILNNDVVNLITPATGTTVITTPSSTVIVISPTPTTTGP